MILAKRTENCEEQNAENGGFPDNTLPDIKLWAPVARGAGSLCPSLHRTENEKHAELPCMNYVRRHKYRSA